MKLLLDQGLPRSAASILRDLGVDTVHTGEIGFATAEDLEIMQRAIAENRIVVTLDSDFHMLLAISNAATPSVIRIRIERLRPEQLANILMRLIKDWRDELNDGAMLTVSHHRVRYHRLPINS